MTILTETLGRTREAHGALERAYAQAVEALQSTTTTLPHGGLWEGPIELTTNVVVGTPCPHCRPFLDEPHMAADDYSWDDPGWVCPRVIVAYNEGGYCTTGTCLDCLLDYVAGVEPR